MKEKATYGNQHTGKMRWGRAVVCAVAGCLAFGLSADVGAESPVDARIPIVGWAGLSQDKASAGSLDWTKLSVDDDGNIVLGKKQGFILVVR